jgi:hypothetical protein
VCPPCAHTHTHTHTCSHRYKNNRFNAFIQTHTHTHTYIHTNTHTHTHTPVLSVTPVLEMSVPSMCELVPTITSPKEKKRIMIGVMMMVMVM